jgi:hypothetical protein
MQKAKRWFLGAAAIAALMTMGALLERVSTTSAVAQHGSDHWRNYRGHWSVWHEADHRWYCTDGRHWFYHDGHDWRLYRFDRSWGRDGFHHGDYRVPTHEVKIVLPHERVYYR